MKKTKLFKTLLVAAALCVGASAWAQTYEILYGTPTYSGEQITGVTAQTDFTDTYATTKDFTDANNNASLNLSGSVLATSTVENWTKDFSEPVTSGKVYFSGIYVIAANTNQRIRIVDSSNNVIFGTAQNNTSNNATQIVAYICGTEISNWVRQPRSAGYGVKELCIDLDAKTVTYDLIVSSGNGSTTELTGTVDLPYSNVKGLFFAKASGDGYITYLDNVTFYSYVSSDPQYTINYKYGDDIVKTTGGHEPVGTTITAMSAITGDDNNRYLISADEAPSITIANGENVLNVPVRPTYKATLSVTTTINGVDNVENIALEESDNKVCSWNYPYPKYVNNGGIYYLCDANTFVLSGTFTDGDVIDKSINYSTADENIVYYREAESVSGNDPNCSWGGGGHVDAQNARDRGISVGTLPAGTYLFTANILGANRRSVVIRQSTNDPLASVGTSNDDMSTGVKSALFMLTAETSNLWINGANSGEVKTNQSEDYDYVLIKKINTMSIVGDFSENGWVTESGIVMTQNTENPAEWTAVVDNFVVTSEKYSYDYKAIANGNFNDYVLPAGDNKNYNFNYDGAREGTYKLTFTVNTSANSVELAIEKQAVSFTVGYVDNDGWGNINAYTFNNETLGGWPGTAMEEVGEVNGKKVYTITFTAENAPANIIFNGGGQQTGNLDFVDNNLYGIAMPQVTVTDAGYATYCSPYALDFSHVSLTAYRAVVTGNVVTFEEVTKVPAGEGVLVKGEANTYDVQAIVNADDIENAFIGTVTGTTAPAGSFVLLNGASGVGFYRALNAFTVGANTAYLPALPGSARTFIGFNFDETTAIDGIAAEKVSNGEVYNLQGQRVMNAKKGLYIMNGKKVLVK